MVAYGFKKQFAPLILDGSKIGTIRADRKRHARPGEELQLYTGMRTRQCRLVARKTCESVHEIAINVSLLSIPDIIIDRRQLPDSALNAFAQGDGFDGIQDMHAFWLSEYGPGVFWGVWIVWAARKCPRPADGKPEGQTAQQCFKRSLCGCNEYWLSRHWSECPR